MKLIVITGTPCTGKSTLAKQLAKKLGFYRLDLSKYYKQISTHYNTKKKCYDIDLKKFEKLVREKMKEIKEIKKPTKTTPDHPLLMKTMKTMKKGKKESNLKGMIIDSHIAHLLPKKLVDLCIVLTCSDLKTLERRLKKRGYSAGKVKENLQAEIFQVCLEEAKKKGHKVKVVDVKKITQKEILNKLTKYL